jgi:hypothetical protein
MNERDDWLSPAAFVAGIDLEANPNQPANPYEIGSQLRIHIPYTVTDGPSLPSAEPRQSPQET